jgi:hypothetical protein
MLRPVRVLLVALLTLSACTTFESLDVGLDFLSADANPEVAAGPNGAKPESEPGTEAEAGAEAEPEAEAIAAEPPSPPPLPRRKPEVQLAATEWQPDPDLLVGLDFDGTKALLGDPALQLEQPPAKVWAYNGAGCMLNVFFYPSVDDKVFRVLTYEVTGGEPAAEQEPATPAKLTDAPKVHERGSAVARRCFADLLETRESLDAG